MLGRVVVTLLVVAAAGLAAQIILSPSNVIGGTAPYSSDYNDTLILDQQTGPVLDYFNSSFHFWLNPDGGPANAYIVIDLGAAYPIASFELFNTHNNSWGDRGTGDFRIVAGNSIVNLGGSLGYDLSGPTVTLVDSTLAAAPVVDPITGQTFAASGSGSYRYIRFEPTSVASAGRPCCGANNYGLNELRVFAADSTVPEPASFGLLAFGVAALALLRRRIAR